MNHEFDIHVSPRDAGIALRRFILRDAGWGIFIAVILCLAFVVYDLSGGSLGYLSVVTVTIITLLALMYLAAYVIRKRQVGDLLERLGDQPVSYRFTESEFSTKSSLGHSSVKWEMVKKLWIDPDVTLVFYSKNGYTTIPTPQIPARSLEFMAEQIKRAGGSILDNNTKSQHASS